MFRLAAGPVIPDPGALCGLSVAVNAYAMSGERLSVLIVAANASAKWGGEAILPLHVLQGLLKAGHDAWMCVGNETKPELDELLGPDAQRVFYVEDARMHSAFRWISSAHPPKDGFQPALLPPGTPNAVAAARSRGATRQKARDRRGAPTDASFAEGAQPYCRPSRPAGHRADERRDGISRRLSLPAAARGPRSEEPRPELGERSATPCRREASS